MKLELALTPLEGFPSLQGAHQLSWNYLLDKVFADAYHAGVGTLQLTLPSHDLVAEAELRAHLTPARGDKTARAILGSNSTNSFSKTADTLYLLRYGLLAGSLFRNHTAGSRASHLLSVFTWQARAFGLPIRALGRSPQLVDRASFAMRRVFASDTFVPAYYHLYKVDTSPKPSNF
jgi:hypothetical protein